ncbi:putative POPLD, Ribonuclease P/MRP, subunit POP1 protein [Trachipleistophora hominis]|uniref:Putative POPLD, Ribonuclease P/MRP, subunit POP1 protein n=1 Tax=Trachipleistophora hominis TaxID=72359 RepID=L7JU01_TRAHO|nr:putative POPLD, Ribonuclease P/MRP, subunit POP1 protein [Trachipleistophora hominis]
MTFIDAHEFVNERSNEIQELEKSLPPRKKKNMLFQKLPFYLRRRSSSHHRKRKRNKKGNYYGKRFSMICVNGHKIAYQRFEKTSSLLHKGGNFIYSMVYCHGYVYRIDCDIEQQLKNYGYHDVSTSINTEKQDIYQNYSQKNTYTSNIDANFRLYLRNGSKFQMLKTKKFLILLTLDTIPEFLKTKQIYCEAENIFEILKEKELSSSGIYELINGTMTRSDVTIDDYFSNMKDNCVLKLNADFSLLLIFRNLKTIFGSIIRIWRVIGLEEYLRLSLNYGFLVFPFDDVNSDWYKQYEREVFYTENQKYFRTPKGKRYDYSALEENIGNRSRPSNTNQIMSIGSSAQHEDFIFPYKFPSVPSLQFTYLFECKKGNLQRCARIYCSNNENIICGYVLRGSFSYFAGTYRGVMVLSTEWDNSKIYVGINIRSSQKYILTKIN